MARARSSRRFRANEHRALPKTVGYPRNDSARAVERGCRSPESSKSLGSFVRQPSCSSPTSFPSSIERSRAKYQRDARRNARHRAKSEPVPRAVSLAGSVVRRRPAAQGGVGASRRGHACQRAVSRDSHVLSCCTREAHAVVAKAMHILETPNGCWNGFLHEGRWRSDTCRATR